MADYREFLRILEHNRPGRAVGFEYAWEKSLAEQLIWRRGASLWQSGEERARTLVSAAARCGLDCAVLELEEKGGGFPAMEAAASALPPEMKLAAGLTAGLWGQDERLPRLLAAYRALAAEDAVCAVIVRRSDGAAPCDRQQFREVAQTVSGEIHAAGKPCIWADCGETPVPLEWAAGCGFDAVHLTGAYRADTAELWREYHGEFAILGDTRLEWLSRQKPRDILDYCESLQALTGNCGYAFGTGNPAGKPIPYLAYVSVLAALARGSR